MRHSKKFNHLGRKRGHRRALLMNLSNALIEHKRITTTLAKAKALRVHLEPLITKAKTNNTHNRRVVFKYLQNKHAVKELFGPIAAEIGQRPGGYLRIIKTGFRQSDSAEMAMIEFVDYNTVYESAGKKKRTRRSGSSSSQQKGDNLKKIEGIGPKVASLLNAGGIHSFSDLAKKSPEELSDMIKDEGPTFAAMNTSTWSEQATLAAEGKWEELKALQEELKGGVREEE
jgi:large subunit ribosomal protein L17